MRPMSLYESGQSTGHVSLARLFDGGGFKAKPSSLTYKEVVRLICRGGWPGGLDRNDRQALRIPRQYVESLVQVDVSQVDNVARDASKVSAVLRSLARLSSSQAKLTTVRDDVAVSSRGEQVSTAAVRQYLAAMEQIFVVEPLPPWRFSVRSKSQLRVTPKLHFVDPSLAVAAMPTNPAQLAQDPATTGLLFESFCIRDLRIYAESREGQVFFYRDEKGLEADAVVVNDAGHWGAVEIKLGAYQADEAAHNLRRLKNKLRGQVPEPLFLMIITATGGVAYTRDDGVHVVPIDCLGP